MHRKRLQKQLKQLQEEGFTVSYDDGEYVFRKGQQQLRVALPVYYPFREPNIQKKKGQEWFVYMPPQWNPSIWLKKAFADEEHFVSPRQRLLHGGQRAGFQNLRFSSPFVSMSLLKPVSSYPDESFDYKIVPYMMNSPAVRELLREKNVRLLTFGHEGIAVGVLEPAFGVLCRTFGITVEQGHRILLSDFFRLPPREQMFIHLCFADLFKRRQFTENQKAELLQMTNRYLDALRSNGLLTTNGYDYAKIHNQSLVFGQRHGQRPVHEPRGVRATDEDAMDIVSDAPPTRQQTLARGKKRRSQQEQQQAPPKKIKKGS